MRTERTTVEMGSDGQLVYGMTITWDVKQDHSGCWQSINGFWSWYLLPFLSISNIVASATVLILSKHEQPHVPLRTWIVGIISAMIANFATFSWYYFYYKRYAGVVSNYGLDTILRGHGPVVGCDLRFIRFFVRAGTPIRYFNILLGCFTWVWLIIGCVWILKGSSSRSDAPRPRLYWLCVSFAISGGIGCVIQLVIFTAGCYYILTTED